MISTNVPKGTSPSPWDNLVESIPQAHAFQVLNDHGQSTDDLRIKPNSRVHVALHGREESPLLPKMPQRGYFVTINFRQGVRNVSN